jgi:hemolysin activation/secretion protein
LRGYDWSERTGDQGAMGMAELRYTWNRPLGLARRVQVYAFVDGGKVTNHEAGFGSGSLASAGGGLRAELTRTFGANLELATPLSGPRYDTGDQRPKLNFRLLKSF